MKIYFERFIIDKDRGVLNTVDLRSMLTCRYDFYQGNEKIGQLEYFGELAYFTINNTTYKIECRLNFPFFIPVTKAFLVESKTGKKLGTFSGRVRSLFYDSEFKYAGQTFKFKQIEPKYKSDLEELMSKAPRRFTLFNEGIVINYSYTTKEDSDTFFYTQNLVGEIEWENEVEHTTIYSGIYFIEPLIGNRSYSSSSTT